MPSMLQSFTMNDAERGERERRVKGKKPLKRVAWADEVGGELLWVCRSIEEGEEKVAGSSKNSIRDQKFAFKDYQRRGRPRAQYGGGNYRGRVGRSHEDAEAMFDTNGKNNTREPKRALNDFQQRESTRIQAGGLGREGRCRGEGDDINCSIKASRSYKEALLWRGETHHSAFTTRHSPRRLPPPTWAPKSRHQGKRCFRCLASDHVVAECRDPVRCFRCRRTGHRAILCKRYPAGNAVNMNRALQHRGREPVTKVYVPYTEEYLRRVELRRNAILADVIPPANLGPDPIITIKNALASRFGGYNDDFAVARCRERDFAIFLPEWVPAEVLVRREVLTLNGFWLRCFPWGQYRYVRHHRVQYRAWIRLINLPFEIWTVARVAALVSGFGRFIKADEATKAMKDLRAFRCQIALDSIYSIPQNLSVIIGEELFPVMIHLERWERQEDRGDNAPPAPPRNDGDGAGAPEDGRDPARQAGDDDAGRDEEMEDAPGELEEVDSVPQTHSALGA
uniref:CCHC-type domain-containing protein n=1 Tax=Ananas comosus var. bracteatus TaxID=296719 RepID=A0A6V7QDP0_ANACO|nr:unnamed protein product [Ananas comosus var. bracteatus]